MTRLGVVVPAFRPDVGRLESYLRDLAAELDPATLRVELDDPAAATLEALSALEMSALEVDAVPYRRGKGAAVTAGFEALSTDRLAFADADGSTPAAEVRRVVDALDEAGVVVGSRRHPDAEVVGHRTFARRFLGDGFAWLARRLLEADLYDYQCGAKALWEDRPGSTVSPVRTSLSMATALFVARHRAKRLGNSPLHDAIARGEEPTALVERGSHRRR
ncbi:dolichol-P-glucose transferase [Halobacteriales archaeon QS_9_68_42]|nr:MAG: dolichol-P-glucose transferase [Halobacteriales archaeon QS_9_68_42]